MQQPERMRAARVGQLDARRAVREERAHVLRHHRAAYPGRHVALDLGDLGGGEQRHAAR
jgi:hypothetical protein